MMSRSVLPLLCVFVMHIPRLLAKEPGGEFFRSLGWGCLGLEGFLDASSLSLGKKASRVFNWSSRWACEA